MANIGTSDVNVPDMRNSMLGVVFPTFHVKPLGPFVVDLGHNLPLTSSLFWGALILL